MPQIAIVGMSCMFPGAPTLEKFWSNILGGVDAITEVPAGRWESGFYDPDSTAVDRFYCRRGGFVDDLAVFEPIEFGVMPKAVEAAEPDQLLALKIGIEALRDAGYMDKPFPRERTGVIIGRGNYITAGGARLGQQVRVIPQVLLTLKELFPELGGEAIELARSRLHDRLSYFGPDVAAGMIPNLVASRLANRLDLRGPAFTVDAACASSLIALEHACNSLRHRQTDMMVVGGVHLCHDLTFWATFCQLGALSRTGMIRPFSNQADGILAGEGIGMVVLKRLDDAIASGDRIYACIEGIGSASDGRSSSLVAPSPDGQQLALERAWSGVGFSTQSIGLLEAHGTGTPAGDDAELETLRRFFGPPVSGVERAVIGSVKSMIGHTMPAAGMAGLIKASLSVFHGLLPPSLHCQHPNPLLAQTRFQVVDRVESWRSSLAGRVAAVNAFGFGGINAHVVLRGHGSAPVSPRPAVPPELPRHGHDVLLLSADSPQALLARLDAGERDKRPGKAACRLAILDPDDKKLKLARKAIVHGHPWRGRSDIYFSPRGLVSAGGKLALVFPGIDSAFVPRIEGLPEAFGLALPKHCSPARPDGVLLDKALGVLELNRLIFDVLVKMGVRADALAGHSIGEWSAMHASRMMRSDDLEAEIQKSLSAGSVAFPDVLFLAAGCSASRLEQLMNDLQGVCVSHDNCPHQAIACGDKRSVETLAVRLREAMVVFEVLPFVSGFHSPLFRDHIGMYRHFFESTAMGRPDLPVWSATTAGLYPEHAAAQRDLAIQHLLMPVRFSALINAMYDAGYRVFIQAGTGSLVGFIGDILQGRPHLAIHANTDRRSALSQLVSLSGALWAEGLDFDDRLLHAANPGASVPVDKPVGITGVSRLHRPAKGRPLALGVPLIRLGEPLRLPGVGPRPGEPVHSAADSGHPVERLIRRTLADVEQATREAVSLFERVALQPAQQRAFSPVVGVTPVLRPVTVAHRDPATGVPIRLKRLLDIDSTIPYVVDHALYPQREGWPVLADRYPVVPMTMEIELVREAVEEIFPGRKVIELQEVKAYKWLSVSKPCTIDITVLVLAENLLVAEIEGYFRTKAVVGAGYPVSNASLPGPLLSRRDVAISASQLYLDAWMFHGPAYQGIANFQGIGEDGIDGEIRVPSGKGALLDNMGQLAGYWVMEQPENCLAMPIGVDRIRFFGPDPGVGQEMLNRVRVKTLDAEACRTDHVLTDGRGQIRVVINGWTTRRYQMDQDLWFRSRQLQRTRMSELLDTDVVLFHDAHDSAIMRDHLACRYLSGPEVQAYERLQPRRRRQWLNGRIAAKDAVRAHLQRVQGIEVVYPKELRIENEPTGAPRVIPNVSDTVPHGVHVSLAHTAGLAVAIAGSSSVGIDVEKIEPREDSFCAMVFSEQELSLMEGEERVIAITRAWVAKEAVAKLLEIGLGGNLRRIVVEAMEPSRVRVQGFWVQTRRIGQHVAGWTVDRDLSESQG